MTPDESVIRELVTGVIAGLTTDNAGPPSANGGIASTSDTFSGVFEDIWGAVYAADKAFQAFSETSLATRHRIVTAMRRAALDNAERFSRLAVEETGMGRVDDKIVKNRLAAEATPGPEDLEAAAATDDDGLVLTERAPYGVIGAITPSTNPTESIINNGISMVSAGNSVVFHPHPAAKHVSALTISVLNDAIQRAGGPRNLLTTVANPTIESAEQMMDHMMVSMLVVTGGPGVVRAAMQKSKKVIAAGPGNPPVVVDETADIPKAARDIVAGASLDNNIICIDEKEVLP